MQRVGGGEGAYLFYTRHISVCFSRARRDAQFIILRICNLEIRTINTKLRLGSFTAVSRDNDKVKTLRTWRTLSRKSQEKDSPRPVIASSGAFEQSGYNEGSLGVRHLTFHSTIPRDEKSVPQGNEELAARRFSVRSAVFRHVPKSRRYLSVIRGIPSAGDDGTVLSLFLSYITSSLLVPSPSPSASSRGKRKRASAPDGPRGPAHCSRRK